MKLPRLLAALVLLSCSSAKQVPEKPAEAIAPKPPSAAEIWKPVVQAPDRLDADKALDEGRKPAEMLQFFQLQRGMKVAELGAGGGYTSELMSRAVGDEGKVYAENPPQWAGFAGKALDARVAKHPNMVRVDRPVDDPLPPEAKNLDAVVIMATYHDFVDMGADRARMNQVIFNALQPGGAYIIIDSSAKDGTGADEAGKLHRIDEAYVLDEVKKAGFQLESRGDFLRNPADARDWNAAPGATPGKRGTGDRFALRFIRPQGSKAQVIAPKLRLPAGVSPKRVSAELTIIPTQETFSGKEELVVNATEPTPILWLGADELTIKAVEPAAKIIPGGERFVGLQFETPLPAGETTLRLSWEGKLSATDYEGAFRQQENGEWYVVTALEAMGARRILPSFDEPSFKIPWKMALRVRKEDAAYFNTPVESSNDEPGGLKLVKFAETKPLPSYLLAFGVGPFERVDAGKMKSGAPVGIITTKGKKSWAKYSAESSPKLMNILESYFGIPYHYPKLDLIEIPLGTGAMENPGLITFNQRINLAKPGEDTPQFQRRAATVEAHEFAHLWFGDMVTTAWWDDIWLNEAFAQWAESRVTEEYMPKWDEAGSRASGLDGALNADRLLTARRIRQPIWSEGDIKNAFDRITYDKGAAVIRMFETYIGPDKFQKGIQRYLKAHEDQNATAKDFLAALSEEAGKDIAPAFSSFLDQAGAPLVKGTVSCDNGKGRIALEQSRYVTIGADPKRVPPQTWQIPLCVKTDKSTTCTLFTGKTATMELDHCPSFAMLNAGASGYYRSQLDEAAQAQLQKSTDKLTTPEKQIVIFDVIAAARAGTIDYARTMELATAFAGDRSRYLVDATMDVPQQVHASGYLAPELRPRFAAWVRDLYGKRAKALGWKVRKGESLDDTLLRPAVLGMVGDEGEDAQVRAEARKVANAWLANHKSTTPDLAVTALHLAAISGDRAFFDQLHAAAKAEKDRSDRQRILAAMGSFRDPAIASAALPLTLTDEFDARESTALLFGASGWETTRQLALDFVKQNYDALLKRLPRDTGAGFASFATRFCDEAHRKDAEEFFGPRVTKQQGGERRFSQAMEGLKQCMALREKAAPSIAAFLSARPAPR